MARSGKVIITVQFKGSEQTQQLFWSDTLADEEVLLAKCRAWATFAATGDTLPVDDVVEAILVDCTDILTGAIWDVLQYHYSNVRFFLHEINQYVRIN
jgi:hypothetical protein